jgi:hypothetical protein
LRTPRPRTSSHDVDVSFGWGQHRCLKGHGRHIGRSDLVKADCAAYHQVALLTPEALLRVGRSPAAKLLDLKDRLRCRGYGRKGRAVVSIKVEGAERLDQTSGSSLRRRSGAGLEDYSRRRSLLGLVRPDRDRQAPYPTCRQSIRCP